MQSTWPGATVWVDPNSLPADGTHEATVRVDLGQKYSSERGGATVTLVSSDPYALIRQPHALAGDGKTSGGIRATRPGVQTITAWLSTGYSLGMVGQPISVTFTPAAPDGNDPNGAAGDPILSLVVDHATAAADADAPALFVLTVKDSLGRPLANRAVSLRPSRAGDQVVPTEAMTDAQGRVEVALTGASLGDGGILASVGSFWAQASVAFVAGPPQAAQSTLQARSLGVRADGVEALAFDARARDAAGRPVPYAAVAFASSVGGDVLSPRTAVADATGLATSWLRGTRGGPRTVTATLQSGTLTASATLVPALADAAASTLLVSPNDVLADGVSAATLTLTVRDASGGAVPNAAVTWGADGVLNHVVPATGVTDGNGVATAAITSTRAQNEVVNATCGGAEVMGTLMFHPGILDANQSGVSVSSDFQPADGNSPITLSVQLRDAWGNGLPNTPLQLLNTGNPAQFSAIGGFTNPSGAFTSTLVSRYAGVHRISAKTGAVRFEGAAHFSALAPSCPQNAILGAPPAAKTGHGAQYCLAAADLNGDGHLDLVSADDNSGMVSVLLGQGHGAFAGLSSYPVGQTPQSVAVADFDGDGYVDVVSADYDDNTVSVLINQGDGRLGASAAYSIGAAANPLAVVVADFNEDGHSDVATANDSGDVSILSNQGNGSFSASTVFSVAGQWTSGLAVADLNHDGHQDLIITDAGNDSVSVFLGYGNNTFAPEVTYGAGQSPYAVVVADFNNDGNNDVACPNFQDNTVSLFMGVGDGSLALFQTLSVGSRPANLLAVDLNTDGNMDLVSIDSYAQSASVLLGDGAMGMATAKPYSLTDSGYSVLAGDFFGDGHLDLLWADHHDVVDLLRGVGDGTFVAPFDAVPSFPVGNYSGSVFAGDFDGDGATDLAVTNYDDGAVMILLAQQDGNLLAPVAYPVGAGPFGVDGGDLNGDGQLDLMVANGDDSTVSVLLGQGGGAFATAVSYASDAYPSDIKVADLNGDGLMDAVAVNRGDNTVSIFIGQGDGNLLPAVAYPVGGSPSMIALVDLNGDGLIDLITADSNDGTVSVLLGQSNGTFSAAAPYPADDAPAAIAPGDINEDGYMDVVVGTYNGTIALLLGVGDGSLLPASIVPLNVSDAHNVWVSDFDGDGHLDVMSLADMTASLLLGRGDGTFLSSAMFRVARSPALGGFAADMNNDGRVDIVVADTELSRVNILLNTCGMP